MDQCPRIGLHPQGWCERMPAYFPFARCGLYQMYSAHSGDAGLELS